MENKEQVSYKDMKDVYLESGGSKQGFSTLLKNMAQKGEVKKVGESFVAA